MKTSTDYIGKNVTVIIDRLIGSKHLQHICNENQYVKGFFDNIM